MTREVEISFGYKSSLLSPNEVTSISFHDRTLNQSVSIPWRIFEQILQGTCERSFTEKDTVSLSVNKRGLLIESRTGFSFTLPHEDWGDVIARSERRTPQNPGGQKKYALSSLSDAEELQVEEECMDELLEECLGGKRNKYSRFFGFLR